MTSNLNTLTLKQTLDGVKQKDFTMKEVLVDVHTSTKTQNKKLNVYLTMNEDVEHQVANASSLPLAGAPLAVKDNFSTKGLRTTASAKPLDTFIPQFDSTVSRKLKEAGAAIIGKTNMDAWAHGSSTETSQYGPTLNPRNTDHLPGGSSGGSAAAVAADMCIAAIGSETAGSIRQPAAWCGTVGFKPTYGRVSRYGVVSMASSTDSPGPITKTVEDSAILLNYLAGQDINDATTAPKDVPDFTKSIGQDIKGLKIGVMYLDYKELAAIKPIYEHELKRFEELGATVEFVQAMDPRYAISVYTVVQRSEVSSNLARYTELRYGNGRNQFGDEAKRRIMLGTFTLSKGYAEQYYNLAQKVRTLFRQDFDKLFSTYDILISPTAPSYADKIGITEGKVMYGELADVLVEASSVTGLPAISVPCHRDEKTNLYLGLNIMAPMWQEERIFQVAHAYEQNSPWNSWLNKKEKNNE